MFMIWNSTLALAVMSAGLFGSHVPAASDVLATTATCCCGAECPCEACDCDGQSCTNCECEGCDCDQCQCGDCDEKACCDKETCCEQETVERTAA